MESLAESRSDLSLKRIDIKSWGSPVAKQYNIKVLPTLHLYRDGELVTKGTQSVLSALQE